MDLPDTDLPDEAPPRDNRAHDSGAQDGRAQDSAATEAPQSPTTTDLLADSHQANRGGTATSEPTKRGKRVVRPGDLIFAGASRGSGILLLVVMAAIATFLTIRSVNAISVDHGNFFTTSGFDIEDTPMVFGMSALVLGTVVSAVVAMVLAVPVSIGVALFISHLAPRRMAQALGYVVDLLAAVPSIVYGLWGALFLVPHMLGVNAWLNQYFAWTYVFKQDYAGDQPRSLFTVGVLLAIMILPIVTAVTREIFLQVPRAHEEAALALGATRWEVIRTAVLPFARSGIISASMLGLGRALGETMAVATVLSPSLVLSLHITDPGGSTIAQNIATQFGDALGSGRDALIASGLVLFIITLLVNGGARLIIARRKDYSGANA